MERFAWPLLLIGLLLTGCPPTEEAADSATPAVDESAADSSSENADGSADTANADAETVDATEPSTDGDTVELSADNTLIQFVGVHTDPEKPDPRTGRFEDFTGTATVSDGNLQAVHVDINTESLTTEIEKLTTHLKSGDFFNVNEFPKAEFQSTSIEDAGDGKVNITGDLTLLGKTNSILFPATVSTDDGLAIDATFTIDRTQFGMDYGVENVKKEVEMTVKLPK